jgi:hypothetical protein
MVCGDSIGPLKFIPRYTVSGYEWGNESELYDEWKRLLIPVDKTTETFTRWNADV